MTKLLEPIVVDGLSLPIPSEYKFELKKTYVTEPTRNNSGAIAVFPEKFLVPYFTATWKVMKLDDYSAIMKLVEEDENTVRYYDTNNQEYKTAKFYIQQPSYNRIYTRKMMYDFVTDFQLVFVATLND